MPVLPRNDAQYGYEAVDEGWVLVDWRVMATTFALVFVAELGDKTQLATMLLAAKSRSALPVFLGAASALVLSALLGVMAGGFLTRLIPIQYLQIIAGSAFMLIGALLLWNRI